MSRETEYIDNNSIKWITPARAAEIWNERAREEYGVEGNYTRWSVFQRKKLQTHSTPGGKLYLESEIRSVKLRPHPPRPDVAEANRKRKRDTQ